MGAILDLKYFNNQSWGERDILKPSITVSNDKCDHLALVYAVLKIFKPILSIFNIFWQPF